MLDEGSARVLYLVARWKKGGCTMLDANDYQEIAQIMQTIIESSITPKLNLLAENQRTLLETLAPKSRVDELQEEVDFLKSIIKLHSEQIAELKKAQ